MSLTQPSCRSTGSTERPITFTLRLSNSGLIFAMYPSSVVQTGVKSLGWENSTAHESPIQSWNLIGPSVVCASKSGAVSPMARPMDSFSSSSGSDYAAAGVTANGLLHQTGGGFGLFPVAEGRERADL